jgi:hypothetical protein
MVTDLHKQVVERGVSRGAGFQTDTKTSIRACEYANRDPAWAHPKMLTGTDEPHTRRTSGPLSAIKHHGTTVERIAHRKSAHHPVAPPLLTSKRFFEGIFLKPYVV